MSDSNDITVLNPGLYKNLVAFTSTVTNLALKQGLGTLKQQKDSASS